MKHTFASVLPLFVAALGEPSHEFDADDVRDYGFHHAYPVWTPTAPGPRTATLGPYPSVCSRAGAAS